ncbi:Cell adhesion molecule 2 [Manis javanica]|nr:Cell adhesion molecule 2 [Manis javanica]
MIWKRSAVLRFYSVCGLLLQGDAPGFICTSHGQAHSFCRYFPSGLHVVLVGKDVMCFMTNTGPNFIFMLPVASCQEWLRAEAKN